MERDVTPSYVAVTSAISTHTLTWSVTQGGACCFCNEDISTHTLTWSVTIPMKTLRANKGISTHTLTWSVTLMFIRNIRRR